MTAVDEGKVAAVLRGCDVRGANNAGDKISKQFVAQLGVYHISLDILVSYDQKSFAGTIDTILENINIYTMPKSVVRGMLMKLKPDNGNGNGGQVPPPLKSWKETIQVFYNENNNGVATFGSQNELIQDISKGGLITTQGKSRRDLITSLLRDGENLNNVFIGKLDRTKYNTLNNGPRGIGKTTIAIEVGKRLPYLYPKMVVIYISFAYVRPLPNVFKELLPFVTAKVGSSDRCYYLLIDECEEIFRDSRCIDFMDQFSFVNEMSINVIMHVFGTSQVLEGLLRGTLPVDIANVFGYHGFTGVSHPQNQRPTGTADDKLTRFPASAPATIEEAMYVHDHICNRMQVYNNHKIGKLELYQLTWFFGGIARKIIDYYIDGSPAERLVEKQWIKLEAANSKDAQDYYRDICENSHLKAISTVEEALCYVMQHPNAFEEIEKATRAAINNNQDESTDDSKENGGNGKGSKYASSRMANLTGQGYVKKDINSHDYYPTYPFCVLLSHVLRKNHSKTNFICWQRQRLILPNERKAAILQKIKVAETNGYNNKNSSKYSDYLELVLLQNEFSQLCNVPAFNQHKLVLSKFPYIIDNDSSCKSKYYGVMSIDILGFGAINNHISPAAADDTIIEFGSRYDNIGQKYLNSNTFEYFNIYHINGDAFCIICTFDDFKDFESLGIELSQVEIKCKLSNNGKSKVDEIPVYGRIGGIYGEIDKNESIKDAFDAATKVENSIKERGAMALKFKNGADMKNSYKDDASTVRKIQDSKILLELKYVKDLKPETDEKDNQ